MEEKEKMKIENGDRNYFFVTDNGSSFGIAFDKIFEQNQLDVFNVFDLGSKRNFKNLVDSILETYEEIFFEDNKFNDNLAIILFHILDVKCKLMLNDGTSYDDFQGYINDIVDSDNGLLLRAINNYVEMNYGLELDKTTADMKAARKKINIELQFSDRHAKELLKISYLYRIMIPVISVFLVENKEYFGKPSKEDDYMDLEEFEMDEINSKLFAYLFEKVSSNPTALRNKLYKLTYSRVSRTAYSDKRFWTRAKDNLITKDTVAVDIYRKLLTNALPKLSIAKDRNIVSFLQSVINNQISFLFQNKFKYRIFTIGKQDGRYTTEDDDSVSEYEKMEIQMLRRDEGEYIIRKTSIYETLKILPEKLNVEYTEAEVQELMKTLTRHVIQERIVAMVILKYFGDKMAIKFLDFYSYASVILMTKKYLENNNFKYLPQILVAQSKKHKEKIQISGKSIKPRIYTSKKYTQLFETKYKHFADDVKKPLDSLIATTYGSVFLDDKGNELFDSSVKVDRIADELLDLAYLV